ncbi:hypothetical protein EJB05_26789, partial [Eragrostis curvula]
MDACHISHYQVAPYLNSKRMQGINKVTDPELAESIVFRRAVLFAIELRIDQAIIATDCLSLINKLKSKGLDRSHTGSFIRNIKIAAQESPVPIS